MNQQLLTTKLFIPPLRPGLVSRGRLVQKMSAGLQANSRLTLITAPAGYGKTTLALEWLASLGRPYGWLSLEQEDNNPVQFLTYLVAALQQVEETIGKSLPPFEQTPEGSYDAAWLQSRLAALVNDLAECKEPFVMALDDYHIISDLAVHQAMEFILAHQPPQLHLVIITRQDPLLPLSKLRSRGQLTEVRLGELRFTREEAERFFNGTMRLELLPEQVAALEARTEGWIAGLQLAALSLSELPAWSQATPWSSQRSKYIRSFAGDDRHVVDYLMDEVLSRQSEEIQNFLLRTSVLKRLSGPLCDFVLDEGRKANDENHSPFALRPSSEILAHLDRSNLFLIPLDNRRQWYRYHHLFAELLGSRLLSCDPELVLTLHRRASEWYENAGIIADAVDHALLAEDFDRALRLIETTASASIWTSGDLPVLMNWSRRLPEGVLMARPRLSLYHARGLFFNGKVEAAERYLRGAEDALRARNGADGSNEELWGVLFTNQATVQAMLGHSETAQKLAAQALQRVPEEDHSTQARIQHAVGMADYLHGDVRRAEAAFAKAVQFARLAGNRNLGLDVVSCLALAQILSGRLRQAAITCEEALAADPENLRAPAASTIYLALGQVHFEQNDLAAARASLETCLQFGRRASWPHLLWQAYLLQAQVEQALGDESAAQEALLRAEGVAQRYSIGRVARMVAAGRARVELAAGQVERAANWAEDYRRLPVEEGLRDFEELTLARVLASCEQETEALGVLDRLLASASLNGRLASVIAASVLRSRLLARSGNQEAALEAFAGVLDLAEPEGWIRVFVTEGSSLASLLSQTRQSRVTPAVVHFTGNLLAAFKAQGIELEGSASSAAKTTYQAAGRPSRELDGLVEPLSAREREVLGLIAEGLSNPEIAARLYLSVNTLRAHSANIYQKLDVHNRVQAVARARELGLLARA